MELVPIIWSVLKIVSLLAIGTLLLSYITFKFRQKKTPLIPSIEKNLPPIRPKFLTNSLKRITKYVEKRPVRIQEVKKEEKAIPKAPERIVNQNPPRIIQKPVERPVKHKTAEHKRETKRKEPPSERRLEVVKNLSMPKDAAKPNPKDKKPLENFNTVGNDVFDNYHDKDDNNMFPLKVDKETKD